MAMTPEEKAAYVKAIEAEIEAVADRVFVDLFGRTYRPGEYMGQQNGHGKPIPPEVCYA